MGKRMLIALVVALLVAGGAGIAAATQSRPALSAHGPTRVSGTDATAVFRVGDRTVRQVRYQDRGTLGYTFVLANDGRLPVTVTGLCMTRFRDGRIVEEWEVSDAPTLLERMGALPEPARG